MVNVRTSPRRRDVDLLEFGGLAGGAGVAAVEEAGAARRALVGHQMRVVTQLQVVDQRDLLRHHAPKLGWEIVSLNVARTAKIVGQSVHLFGPRRPRPQPDRFGPMQYTHLGRTGLRVSRICLGTMNFGPETDEPTSFSIMDSALEAGINFFDSANVYGRSKGRGATEEIVGRWFAQGGGRREKVVIATKLYGDMGDWPNEGRLSALNIRRACDASLKRLQTDYIDLYQMHHIDRGTPLGRDLGGHGGPARPGQDPLRRLVELRRLAHRQGAGGGGPAQLHRPGQRAVDLQPASCATIELEVLPAAEDYGLGVIPWSPLQGGLLGGVVRKERDGSRRYAGRAAETIEAKRPAARGVRGPLCRDRRGAGHGRAGLAADPAGGDRADRRAAHARAPRRRPCAPSTSRSTTRCWPASTRSSPATRRRRRTTPGRRSRIS